MRRAQGQISLARSAAVFSLFLMFLSCEEADERGSRAAGPDRTLSRSATGGETLLMPSFIIIN